MGVREKMKVFLVACFISITFFSQGWGGKHYLIKTKDKANKYGPEAGDDYNNYAEDEDVEDHGDAVDAYDDDTYDDGTNDDDTYNDEENEEVIDVEAMLYDSNKTDEEAIKSFESLPFPEQNDVIDALQEAAMEKEKNNESADYSNKLATIRHMLKVAQAFLDVLLSIMGKSNRSTLRSYKIERSTYELREDCYRKCRERGYKKYKSKTCHKKCKRRFRGKRRTDYYGPGK